MPASIILRFLFLLALTSFFATKALAQRDNDPMAPGSLFEISGQVRSVDNKTVENVMVRLETHSGALVDQITTDSMGRFRFTRLRQGPYRVTANAGGASSPAQFVDLSRSSPRIHVLLQLVTDSPTFASRERTGVIDVRVPAEAKAAFDKGVAALAEKNLTQPSPTLRRPLKSIPTFTTHICRWANCIWTVASGRKLKPISVRR